MPGFEMASTRRGGSPSKSTIERMLKNPFYTGRFIWDGKIYDGDHEPLVSEELFQRVQQAFRKGNHPVKESSRSFAYTGLIKCEHCGCSITAGTHKGRYVYYRCTNSRGICKPQLIREDRLEELLGELVAAIHIDEDTAEWAIAALKESHSDEREYHAGQIAKLQAEITRLQTRLDAAYEDRLDGRIGDDYWERMSRKWRDQRMELQASIERHQQANEVYFDAGVKLLRLAKRAYDLWLAQLQNEKRKLLDLLSKLHLRWRKAKGYIQKTLLLAGRRVAVLRMAERPR